MKLQKEYIEIAKAYANLFKEDPNVIGVTLNGGVSRGTGDEFSEIDLHFYVKDKNKTKNLPPRMPTIGNDVAINGVWFDIYVKEIEKYKKKILGMSEKWDLANAKIIFDKKNQIKNLIKKKTTLSKDEKIDIEEDYGFGSEWCLQLAEIFVNRGDLRNAHMLIINSLDYFVNYYFYLNKKLIPHFKWKYYYFQKLRRPSKKIKDFIFENLRIKNYSKKEALRKIRDIRKILNKELERKDDCVHEQDINAIKNFKLSLKKGLSYSNPFEVGDEI